MKPPLYGSSPLTRGKPYAGVKAPAGWRLIPAHAGKTSATLGVPRALKAHPRSRGENEAIYGRNKNMQGSSPLTRGKHPIRRARRAPARLIPAHAGKTVSASRPTSPRSAHPRSRGENIASMLPARAALGSSPLTRGKHHLRPPRLPVQRLIPAHAGKTAQALAAGGRQLAHPRSRGENESTNRPSCATSGSSPLTRGKRRRYQEPIYWIRLIPAHAGKTDPHRAYCPHDGAHPRSRGENSGRVKVWPLIAGSSPLTRGKLEELTITDETPRLIPAHAGKTGLSTLTKPCLRAHPRSRGENLLLGTPTPVALGSSPLTRGKPTPGRRAAGSRGLIPAHAGKTLSTRGSDPRRPAHPRSRGENSSCGLLFVLATGSSPLTRGKRHARRVSAHADGLIPAHAGKTAQRTQRRSACPAHPRSRGENLDNPDGLPEWTGSSPLTRGKHELLERLRVGLRLIPAHAGKTLPRPTPIGRGAAHPRSRGENFGEAAAHPAEPGSSPLTRGKPGVGVGGTS